MSSCTRSTLNVGLAAAGALMLCTPVDAQVGVEVVHAFAAPGAVAPAAPLIQATDGNFYGSTERGGLDDLGTIFRMTPGGAVTVLHEFSGPDGTRPDTALVQASDGNLYGMTASGARLGVGTAFRIALEGTFAVLHEFDSGLDRSSAFVEGPDGNLYGTTRNGGAAGLGTVYRMTSTGDVETVHEFFGDVNGYRPSLLIAGGDGVLYGSAQAPAHIDRRVAADGRIYGRLNAAGRRTAAWYSVSSTPRARTRLR